MLFAVGLSRYAGVFWGKTGICAAWSNYVHAQGLSVIQTEWQQ